MKALLTSGRVCEAEYQTDLNGNGEFVENRKSGPCIVPEAEIMCVDENHGFFEKYPGAFDRILTVHALSPTEWRLLGGTGYIFVSLKNSRLRAKVNSLGTIVSFIIRNYMINDLVVYSPKYDRFFKKEWCVEYAETNANSAIFETIKELYQEEDT